MIKYSQNVMARIFLEIWAYHWLTPTWYHDKLEFKKVALARKANALILHDKYLVDVDKKGLLHPKTR